MMEMQEENRLHCPICGFGYLHILGTIQLKADKQTGEALFKLEENTLQFSSGHLTLPDENRHILFKCEQGDYFIKSFDGKDNKVYVDENHLMDELTLYLNNIYKDIFSSSYEVDEALLKHIQTFLDTLG